MAAHLPHQSSTRQAGNLQLQDGPPKRLPRRPRPLCVQSATLKESRDVVGPEGAFVPGREAESRKKLFNSIAPVYDKLNNELSFGQHWVWKKMAVRWSGAGPGKTMLDVCCGSGDLALLMASAVGPSGRVTGLDFAAEMLRDASSRPSRLLPSERREAATVDWVQGDAMELPFPDSCYDGATMGYGLRNIADRRRALRELHRVLRPGGSVAILDFNNSPDPLVDGAQSWLLENLVVPAARRYGLEEEYQYLRPSIKNFPTGTEQEDMALQAGFAHAKHYEVGFGFMGVLVATKK